MPRPSINEASYLGLQLEKHLDEIRELLSQHRQEMMLEMSQMLSTAKPSADYANAATRTSTEKIPMPHPRASPTDSQGPGRGKTPAKADDGIHEPSAADSTRHSEDDGIHEPSAADSTRHSEASKAAVSKLHGRLQNYERYIVEGSLDVFIGLLVLINVIVIVVQSEANGRIADASLGAPVNLSQQQDILQTCDTIDGIFVLIYVVELLARIIILRKRWLIGRKGIEWFNIFDAVVVCVAAVDTYFVNWVTSGEGVSNLIVARIIGVLRLGRTFRLIRVLKLFRQLRVLASTFAASVGALFWSMVVLAIYMCIGALLLSQSLHGFIVDPEMDADMRVWVNNRYGNARKAFYTMFEVTNSGGWPGYSRPLIERVSGWYSAFYFMYVSVVIFATLKIITALFLKETLSAAATDERWAVQSQAQAKAEVLQKLRLIFEAADTDGDGGITQKELEVLLEKPVVIDYLHLMEVAVEEASAMFDLLDDGDGRVTIEEFCSGIFRLKGQARSLDMITVKHMVHIIHEQCEIINSKLR
eukprot:TRINITY_DN10669_c0_g1_i1.p1 TRINITY_DN10669_c0_g1~~TRINITY_DN10669_c0_g1_i1.p1  ORF type:complete len:530 (-),score=73.75 TRINITY_DN10669_c0_g1_i1:97-1686(-)